SQIRGHYLTATSSGLSKSGAGCVASLGRGVQPPPPAAGLTYSPITRRQGSKAWSTQRGTAKHQRKSKIRNGVSDGILSTDGGKSPIWGWLYRYRSVDLAVPTLLQQGSPIALLSIGT